MDFCFRGDFYIMKEVRVVSFAWDMPTGPPLHSHQNISKGIKVMERTRISTDFCFRGNNYITKKVRVVSLACDMPTGPPLDSYQILSNYLKQHVS